MRILSILVPCIFIFNYALCQSISNGNAKLDSTNRANAIEVFNLKKAFRNSAFGNFLAADSSSRIGDSVNASYFLMKVDPYRLLFENLTPQSIDTFLSNNFALVKSARNKYKALFSRTYSNPKSLAYQTFKKMGDEDQELRNANLGILDTPGLILHYKLKRAKDSVHFAYLYDYVVRNGWPSLADGSIYACVIALHDRKHLATYIPLMRSAVLKGAVDWDVFRLAQYWNREDMWNVDRKVLPLFYNYSVFNASELLKCEVPKCMPEVEKKVREHTPVVSEFYYFSANIDSFERFNFKNEQPLSYLITKINDNILKNNYACDDNFLKFAFQGGIDWVQSESATPEIKIYLFYGNKKELNYPTLFDKLETVGKFSTHSIVFDVNKSALKPASELFLNQLSNWLHQNPQANLEICGHTDNIGDSLSNINLSLARAEEVKKYLIAKGINERRLTTKGYGATQPVQSNSTPQGKATNRRVEFIKL